MLKRLGLGVLLVTVVGTVAWAQGVAKFDGQYVGELTLRGIVEGDCTPPPTGAAYPLTILNGQVRFKYVPRFDTTLIGTVNAKGDIRAARQLKRGLVTMTGHVDGNHNLTADIVSPSCNYSFQTKN